MITCIQYVYMFCVDKHVDECPVNVCYFKHNDEVFAGLFYTHSIACTCVCTCGCLILCGAKVIVSKQMYTKTMYSCYDSVVSIKVSGTMVVNVKLATPYAATLIETNTYVHVCMYGYMY